MSRWLVPAAVVALTALVFLPALSGQFVNWDDEVHFLQNPSYRGLGVSELRWMFTTLHVGNYQPLSWLTLGLDYVLWGMDPYGYHLSNMVIHLLNAWLVYLLALRLISERIGTRDPPSASAIRIAAGAAALFFAIHPLRVEPVAWVSERREVLSASFAIATVLAYLVMADAKRRGRPSIRWLVISIGLFGLSMLAKASAMALPVVLLVLDVWVLRRTDRDPRTPALPLRTLLLEKVPFAVLGLAAAVVAVIGQRTTKALVSIDRANPLQLLARPFYALLFYLEKSIAPVNLSNLYEVPFRNDAFDAHFVVSAIAVVLITATTWRLRHRWPDLFAAWLSYAILLSPVSGIAHGGGQIIADRYTYLPCVGLAILGCGAALAGWRTVHARTAGWAIAGTGTAIVAALGLLSVAQIGTWHDSIALWEHALRAHPLERLRAAGPARENEVRELTARLRDLGDKSVYWAICYNLGVTLRAQGRSAEAAEAFARGAAVSPGRIALRSSWAAALLDQHRLDEATEQIDAAFRIDPNNADALFTRALLRVAQGRKEDALADFSHSLAVDASNPEAHYNLGVLYSQLGRLEDAARSFRRAVANRPDYAQAYHDLGIARGRQGRTDEAIEAFRRAIALRPDYVDAYNNLGVALAIGGRPREAIEAFQHALALDPDHADAKRNLALVSERAH